MEYMPLVASTIRNTEWAGQYFWGSGVAARLVITAKDGGNVLELTKMWLGQLFLGELWIIFGMCFRCLTA